MSKNAPDSPTPRVPAGARVAVVASRFNGDIVDALVAGCRARLTELAVAPDHLELHRVPGAFELPLAAKLLAESGRFAAVICLGCVIRGDTLHFDYVAGSAARGIAQAALETRVPIIFGVLTTENEAQAWARAGHGAPTDHAGHRAADAAAEMIALLTRIKS